MANIAARAGDRLLAQGASVISCAEWSGCFVGDDLGTISEKWHDSPDRVYGATPERIQRGEPSEGVGPRRSLAQRLGVLCIAQATQPAWPRST
jgi:hypothetical protein